MKRLKRILHRRFQHLSGKIPKVTLKQGVLTLFLCLYTLVLIYTALGPLLRVKNYHCFTKSGEQCPDFILPELVKHHNQLIYTLQKDDIGQKLLKGVPQAKEVHITAVWPNSLEAEIIWQDAIATLSIPASTSALLVSTSGDILKAVTEPDPNLPTIIASSAADLIISDHITDPSLQSAIKIIELLHNRTQKVIQIDVNSPNEIYATLDTGKKTIFTSNRSIENQVHTLQLILDQATMGLNLPIIDVRLDRPALKPVQ